MLTKTDFTSMIPALGLIADDSCDSLQVIGRLAEREGLASKVQSVSISIHLIGTG